MSDFLWRIAFKKGLQKALLAAGAAGVAFLAAQSGVLAPFGIEVLEAADGVLTLKINTVVLAGALVALIETGRNYLKHKKKVKWL